MILRPASIGWRASAACRQHEPGPWDSNKDTTGWARAVCATCPVRAECLYDEPPGPRFGIRGGLTDEERDALPPLPADPVAALGVLRHILSVADLTAGVHTNPGQPLTIHPEGVPHTMTDSVPPVPSPTQASTVAPVPVPVGKLLKWGDDHAAPKVRKQAALARAALADLRALYAADQELAALATEAEQLKGRLAELEARQAELAPRSKRKGSSPVRDYDTREVRAWAAAAGVDCPRTGQIPKAVLDAWRAANSPAAEASS